MQFLVDRSAALDARARALDEKDYNLFAAIQEQTVALNAKADALNENLNAQEEREQLLLFGAHRTYFESMDSNPCAARALAQRAVFARNLEDLTMFPSNNALNNNPAARLAATNAAAATPAVPAIPLVRRRKTRAQLLKRPWRDL